VALCICWLSKCLCIEVTKCVVRSCDLEMLCLGLPFLDSDLIQLDLCLNYCFHLLKLVILRFLDFTVENL
jgi:hypothetical protein